MQRKMTAMTEMMQIIKKDAGIHINLASHRHNNKDRFAMTTDATIINTNLNSVKYSIIFLVSVVNVNAYFAPIARTLYFYLGAVCKVNVYYIVKYPVVYNLFYSFPLVFF